MESHQHTTELATGTEGSSPSPAIIPDNDHVYEKTGDMVIHPLILSKEVCAFDQAKAYYEKFPEVKFEDDFLDYCRNGFVVSRPNCFAMVKVFLYKGIPAWFIRFAVGDLVELITCLPAFLPKIAFCRNGKSDQMRVVSTKRLLQLAFRNAKKSGGIAT